MWGTEEDVDAIVRARLKPIRARHKVEVQKLKDKLEIMQGRLDRALDRLSRLEFPDTTGGQGLDRDFTTGEMGQ